MNKKILTTSLAIAIGLSTFGAGPVPFTTGTERVEAAATNVQNNQAAVEAKADQLITLAKSLIGKATYSTAEYKKTFPYKFSCATFLNYIFEKAGVDLATYNENYMMEQGTYVAKGQWQKGDLLFYKSKKTGTDPDHVAMYIGDNKVIHMADPQQNIVISDLNSKPYYTDNYVGARRVLPTLLSANPATTGDKIVESSYNLISKATMGTVNDEKSFKFTSTGFVDHVYKANGITLGTTNIKELMKKGTTVAKANLKKGDLVYFNSVKGSSTPTLVAIYAGDHRIIIPTSTGVLTRVLFVDFYQDHYLTAKRVVTDKTVNIVEQPTSTTAADNIANFATSMVGKAKFGYSYNENNLTFTGAGFTYYVFKKYGIDLKSKLANSQAKLGKTIAKTGLQKGDLLFFSLDNKGTAIKQTGVYIGGNEFIYLPTSGTAKKENINSTWAQKNYVTARRVLN